MTVEITEAPRANLRLKRKRKNHDQYEIKDGFNTTQDTRGQKEEGPSKLKRVENPIEDVKPSANVTSLLSKDNLSQAMKVFQKKYGSEVAKDILKTLNASAPTPFENQIKSEDTEASSSIKSNDNGDDQPKTEDKTSLDPIEMLKCMHMWMQMQIFNNNITMNPITNPVTNANSEFVMRSSYNNTIQYNNDNNDTTNGNASPVNSVVTTMMDSLPLSVPSVNSLPSTSLNQVVSNSVVSSTSGRNISERLTKDFVPIKHVEDVKSAKIQSSDPPRSVTISNPFSNIKHNMKFADNSLLREPIAVSPVLNTPKHLLISKTIDKLDLNNDLVEKQIICNDANVDNIDQPPITVASVNETEAEEKLITTCSDIISTSLYNDTVTSISKNSNNNDQNIVTACCDPITTSVENATVMKYILSDGVTGGSFVEFCNKIIDPEGSDLFNEESEVQEGKSPVYEPITTTNKHTVDVNNNENESKDSFYDYATVNNLSTTSYTALLNSGCSTTLASLLKPWGNEITELNVGFQNDMPISHALISDGFSAYPINGFAPFSSETYMNSIPSVKSGSVEGSWYQNCRENLSQDEDGDTILHIAIAKEDPRVVELLGLLKPDELNIRNNVGQTPLHIASYLHQTDVISALIKAGADEKIIDNNGNTLLHIACEEGSLPMVQCLARSLKRQPGRLAGMMNRHNNNGWTPLHIAVKRRDNDIAKYLVANDSDLDIQDEKTGSTVLVYALMNNDDELSRFLIERGADLNIQTKSGLYPINFAAQSGNIELVKDMVTHDAQIGTKLPEFPACHPNAAEMKSILESELRKRRRKKKTVPKESKKRRGKLAGVV